MPREGTREVVGGLVLLLGGGFYLYAALQYRLGTAVRMGPGYFPMLLGIVGIMIAVAIILRGLALNRSIRKLEDEGSRALSLRPMLAVLAAIALFAVLIHWLGLLIAVAASIAASALGDRRSTVKSTILLVLAVCAASWLVFVYMLGLPIPLIGSAT